MLHTRDFVLAAALLGLALGVPPPAQAQRCPYSGMAQILATYNYLRSYPPVYRDSPFEAYSAPYLGKTEPRPTYATPGLGEYGGPRVALGYRAPTPYSPRSRAEFVSNLYRPPGGTYRERPVAYTQPAEYRAPSSGRPLLGLGRGYSPPEGGYGEPVPRYGVGEDRAGYHHPLFRYQERPGLVGPTRNQVSLLLRLAGRERAEYEEPGAQYRRGGGEYTNPFAGWNGQEDHIYRPTGWPTDRDYLPRNLSWMPWPGFSVSRGYGYQNGSYWGWMKVSADPWNGDYRYWTGSYGWRWNGDYLYPTTRNWRIDASHHGAGIYFPPVYIRPRPSSSMSVWRPPPPMLPPPPDPGRTYKPHYDYNCSDCHGAKTRKSPEDLIGTSPPPQKVWPPPWAPGIDIRAPQLPPPYLLDPRWPQPTLPFPIDPVLLPVWRDPKPASRPAVLDPASPPRPKLPASVVPVLMPREDGEAPRSRVAEILAAPELPGTRRADLVPAGRAAPARKPAQLVIADPRRRGRPPRLLPEAVLAMPALPSGLPALAPSPGDDGSPLTPPSLLDVVLQPPPLPTESD